MIQVKELSKHFGPIKAVDNLSFEVHKGEILGFLGPNGAGKSTTMRMITGFLPPSAGTVSIGGADIGQEALAARAKIGYLPENAPVYPDMTVSAYLIFCSEIRGFAGTQRRRKVDETIERCFLDEVRHQPVSTLSKGFKQRVCFAQSILHDPAYLILDEPTDGLDPNQKHEVRQMIRAMSATKVIILSTHILDEVEAVCTRAIIIADGRIVADDTPAGLKARSASHGAISLHLVDADPDQSVASLERMAGVKTVEILANENRRLNLRVYPQHADADMAQRLMAQLQSGEYRVEALFIESGKLDEVFRAITTANG